MEMKYFPIARVNEVGHRRKEPKDPNEQREEGIIFVKKLKFERKRQNTCANLF